MTKLQFLLGLHDKLSGLPREDVEERLHFYAEMIEDRMEEGIPEEEAVAAVGSVEDISAQILADIPLVKIVKEKVKVKRRRKVWEITLLTLGSPVWVPLLIAVAAVILSLYISIWAVIISLWAVFITLLICAIGVFIVGIAFVFTGNGYVGLTAFAVSLVCAGLAIFFYYGCKAATKGTALLSKKSLLAVKKGFAKKDEA